MAKEHYDQLSPLHKCEDCGKGIKERLLRIKRRPPKKCFKCFKAAKNAAQRHKDEAAKMRRYSR